MTKVFHQLVLLLSAGHPKEASSFARIAGYVEQFDAHLPTATVLGPFELISALG